MRFLPAIILILTTSTANAENLTVRFSDGAPKDSITIMNQGCAITDGVIVLNLEGSAGGLIFDTTNQGAGVEVFQPVEVTGGSATMLPISDGEKVLHLNVQSLPSGEQINLTADLDDTLSGRQITVSGSEIAGASVSLALGDLVESGTFIDNGTATLRVPVTQTGCASG